MSLGMSHSCSLLLGINLSGPPFTHIHISNSPGQRAESRGQRAEGSAAGDSQEHLECPLSKPPPHKGSRLEGRTGRGLPFFHPPLGAWATRHGMSAQLPSFWMSGWYTRGALKRALDAWMRPPPCFAETLSHSSPAPCLPIWASLS